MTGHKYSHFKENICPVNAVHKIEVLLVGVLDSYHLCLLPSTLVLCICLHLLIPNHTLCTCLCLLCPLAPIIAFYACLCLHTYLLLSHLLVLFMATHALCCHLYIFILIP